MPNGTEHTNELLPRQAGFVFRPKLTHHEANPTQAAKILKLLQSTDGWVSALALSAISLQYSARVHELRRQGWRILNHVQTNSSGVKCGQFRLVREYPTIPQASSDKGKTVSTTGHGEDSLNFSKMPARSAEYHDPEEQGWIRR